jgi:hypothetical protein
MATLVVIPGSGHVAHEETSEALLAAFGEFWAGQGGAGGGGGVEGVLGGAGRGWWRRGSRRSSVAGEAWLSQARQDCSYRELCLVMYSMAAEARKPERVSPSEWA